MADGVYDNNVLLTFDVSSYSDGNSDGILDITGGNVYAAEYTEAMRPSGLKLVDGTLFGACYVLPYDKHYDANTLVIEFWVQLMLFWKLWQLNLQQIISMISSVITSTL